jgi:hypothetical protein
LFVGGENLYEFKNVSDVTCSPYTYDRAYRRFNNSAGSSKKTPIYNQDESIIRESFTGDIEAVGLSANVTNKAVSTVQILTDAIETITEKLIRMFEMAQKALFPDDSEEQIEDWQSYLHKLAKEINQIANGVEDNFNKLSVEIGNILSIPIGNGSKIDIFA